MMIYISNLRFPSEKIHSFFAMKTCESFADRGVAVELWIPRRSNRKFRENDPFLRYGLKRNFLVRRLPVIDIWSFMEGRFGFFVLAATFNASILFYAVSRRLLRKAIFYFHTPADAVLLLFVRPKMFLEVHELNEVYRNRGKYIKWFFSRLSGVITTNNFKGDFLYQQLGLPRARLLCQQNATDVDMFRVSMSRDRARGALDLLKDKYVILYTGQLYDWKGKDTLLEVHKFLGPQEFVYIVGVEEGSAKIHNTVMVGNRPHTEMPLWLRAADVLVLPHSGKFDIARYEASPVKLFEYMASGRPIVVADLPSMREVVDDSMVWFFEPDSPQALVSKARYVLSNQEEAEKRARRAREEVTKYTWEKRAENIVSFVNSRLS